MSFHSESDRHWGVFLNWLWIEFLLLCQIHFILYSRYACLSSWEALARIILLFARAIVEAKKPQLLSELLQPTPKSEPAQAVPADRRPLCFLSHPLHTGALASSAGLGGLSNSTQKCQVRNVAWGDSEQVERESKAN